MVQVTPVITLNNVRVQVQKMTVKIAVSIPETAIVSVSI